MIQENQEQESELEEEKTDTDEIQEEEVIQEEEEIKPEKRPLTLEQRRGMLKRQLTQIEKELGVTPIKKVVNESIKKEQLDLQTNLQNIRALQDVHDDDVQEVIDYAKFKGISIAEAKKNPVIKETLRIRDEERRSAEASNMESSRRKSTSQASDSRLLEQLQKGDLPEEKTKDAAKAYLRKMMSK